MKVVIALIGAFIGFGIVPFIEYLEIIDFSTGGWIVLIIQLGLSLLFAIIFLLWAFLLLISTRLSKN